MKCLIDENGKATLVSSPQLAPEDDQCVFQVKACGICGSDIPRVFAHTSYYYPITLGHEFSGIVKESLNKALIGKRACVFPILPCHNCAACKNEQWAMCSSYSYYGSRCDGGMQSELMINENNLIFIPDNVSFEEAAMVEPCAVCLHAIKKAQISKGNSVLIYGAGTIGLLCAMWAKVFGAERIFISDPSLERMSFALSLGFEEYDKTKVDISIEASGSPEALNCAISNTSRGGRIVILGHGDRDVNIKKECYQLILRNQITILGSWNSDRSSDIDDWAESIEAISQGMISPHLLITHRIPLENTPKAFDIIAKKKEFFEKIMVVM